MTTSYASFPGDAAVWADPNIDYAQIHHYDTADDQSYVLASITDSLGASAGKPVIVGEFGFPDQIFSTQNDPRGVNLHNSLWSSVFSGALGAASTWWWDNYVDPSNLYYHFGPVSRLVNRAVRHGEPLVADTATVSTDARADLAIAPGLTDFVRPPESAFAILPDGTLSPSQTALCRFLFAAQYHPELFNPPTFTFDAPKAAMFQVRTGTESGDSPTIVIYVDGQKVLDKPASTSKVYSVPVSAGAHTVLVTNLGLDWITIDQIAVTDYLPAVRALVLRGPTTIAGWVVNRSYTWRSVRNGAGPKAITDAVVTLAVAEEGSYLVEWRSGDTGDLISRSELQVAAAPASLPVPTVVWDVTFELRKLSPNADVTPPVVSSVTLSTKKVRRSSNPAVDVAWLATDNVGVAAIEVQFADDGSHFGTVVGDLGGEATRARWIVPTSVLKSKHGAVRVVAVDAEGNEAASEAVSLKVK